MEDQKIFVIISSLVNVALLGFALFILMNETVPGMFLTLFPLAVGLITFFIVKKGKNFEMMRALKYFNIAYFASYVIPVGVFIGYMFIRQPLVQVEYGVRLDPVVEQCMQACREGADKITNATRECMEKCMERLK